VRQVLADFWRSPRTIAVLIGTVLTTSIIVMLGNWYQQVSYGRRLDAASLRAVERIEAGLAKTAAAQEEIRLEIERLREQNQASIQDRQKIKETVSQVKGTVKQIEEVVKEKVVP
jgi:coenzyme F420-reducing hydrogenase delta subunit